MRVIKQSTSSFKKRVIKRAFATKDKSMMPASVFGERLGVRTYSVMHGEVKLVHRRLSNFIVVPLALGFDLRRFLVNRKKAVVFEIGCGGGNLSADLKEHFRGNIAKSIGLDLANQVWHGPKRHLDKLFVGNALIVRFPKADLIVSSWAMGYIRDPNFLLKKIENALKPGGVALLHFNQKNAYVLDSTGIEKEMKSFNRFFEALAKRGRIGNSKIQIVKANPGIIDKIRKGDKGLSIIKQVMQSEIDSDTLGNLKYDLREMQDDPLILIEKPKKG